MTPRARRAVVSLLAAALVAVAPPVRAADEDAWLSADKSLHFGASAVIAAGGYGLGAVVFGDRGRAAVLGAGLGTAAGVGKELLDATGQGTPSWKDLAWDGIGVVTGVAIAWVVDVLVRGPDVRVTAPAPAGVAFSF